MGVLDNLLRRSSQPKLSGFAAAMGGHDDHVHVFFIGHVNDLGSGTSLDNPDAGCQAALFELGPDGL